MIGWFSDYRVEKWLADYETVWGALHYDDPRTAGAYASEVFGNAYTRIRVVFTDPSNRVIFNVGALSWRGLPACRITHLSIWDAQTNGNLEFCAPLEEPEVRALGGRYDLGAGEWAVSIR